MKNRLLGVLILLGMGIVVGLSTETTAQAKIKAVNTPKVLRGTWVNTNDVDQTVGYRQILITKHWVYYGQNGLDGNNEKVVRVKKLHHYKENNDYIYRLRTNYELPGRRKEYYHYLYLERITTQGYHFLSFTHKNKNLFNKQSVYIKPKEFGFSM